MLAKIDALVQAMAHALDTGNDLVLHIIRPVDANVVFNAASQRHELLQQPAPVTASDGATSVTQPNLSIMSLKSQPTQFATLFRVLSMVFNLVSNDEVVTLRDVYYTNKSSFKSQAESNHYLELVSAILDCGREALHVVASAKACAWVTCGTRSRGTSCRCAKSAW